MRRPGLGLAGALGPPPPDLAGAFDANRDVVTDGLGLWPPELARQVRGQQGDRLLVRDLALGLRGEELLLEAKPGPVEQGLDGALGHLERLGDLPVAQVLELPKGEDEPVLLG